VKETAPLFGVAVDELLSAALSTSHKLKELYDIPPGIGRLTVVPEELPVIGMIISGVVVPTTTVEAEKETLIK
tara:strand:- start:1950 stop:2168 length:219 start_codon:yes stop_codon:yes gene_type:complete